MDRHWFLTWTTYGSWLPGDPRGFVSQLRDDYGLPHTDALHTTERFERPDVGHLNVQVTFDDAQAYTKPWSVDLHFRLLPDTEFLEDICDNERDSQHAVGR